MHMAGQENGLLRKLIRLAWSDPGLRPLLLPLVRSAGRQWGPNQGQYGPGYTTVDPRKPPTNRGKGKCFYKTRDERDRCYVKRDIPSYSKADYNRKYKKKVYNL